MVACLINRYLSSRVCHAYIITFCLFFCPRVPDTQQIIRAGEQISVLVDLSKSHVLALFCTLKAIEQPRVFDFEEDVIFVHSSIRVPTHRMH